MVEWDVSDSSHGAPSVTVCRGRRHIHCVRETASLELQMVMMNQPSLPMLSWEVVDSATCKEITSW